MMSILKRLRAAGKSGVELEFGRRRSARSMYLRFGLVDIHDNGSGNTIFTINEAGMNLLATEKATA